MVRRVYISICNVSAAMHNQSINPLDMEMQRMNIISASVNKTAILGLFRG